MRRNLILWCTLAVSFVIGVLIIVTPVRADSTITVTTTGGIVDLVPANNASDPVVVAIVSGDRYDLYFPTVLRSSSPWRGSSYTWDRIAPRPGENLYFRPGKN